MDGKLLQSDVSAVIEEGRILAPLRAVFEALGSTIEYEPQTQSIDAYKDTTHVFIAVGLSNAVINGSPVSLDVPAKIVNGRTMVPLRFVSEAMGAEVTWNGDTRSVTVNSRPAVEANQEPVVNKPIAPVVESKQAVPASDEIITRDYSWKYGGYINGLQLGFNKGHYLYFKNLPRLNTGDYSLYVTNPNDDAYLAHLVKTFKDVKEQRGYTDRETVDLVIAFIQSLEYTTDLVSTGFDEYPKYPMETLIEQGGDCEDTAILMASLLKEMGYGTVLLRLPTHMAVGVKGASDMPGSYFEYSGVKYYYIETTGDGFQVGDMPDEYKGQKAIFHFLVEQPLISFTCQTNGTTLYVAVKNDGTGAAENLIINAAFDAGNGMVYNMVESDRYTLAAQSKVLIPLTLSIPRNVHTRLKVRAVNNGIVLTETDFDWIDTN